MNIGKWMKAMLAAAPFLVGCAALTGCGDFWQAPGGGGNTSFTLTNSGNISVAPDATSSPVTITVTPASTFTGTVTLSCAITSSPTGASSANAPTCALDSTSLTFSTDTAQTTTLTATTQTGTTTGAYNITVTGVSGNVSETTTVCAEVSTSGAGCGSTASTSGDFYILNSDSIAGYSISSGTLTQLSGSPTTFNTGYTPSSMAIDPSGHFLYVATTDGGIFLYDIGSGGALTLQTPSPAISVAADVTSIQVDSSGTWLLIAGNTTGAPILYAWPISKSTGLSTLASGSNPPAVNLVSGGSASGMAISPDNNLVAVAAGTATQTFTFASGDANPLAGNVYTTNAGAGTAVSVAFSPQTSYLYIGQLGVRTTADNSGGLRILPIANDVPGSDPAFSSTYPYPSGGTTPHAILATSAGYVYVANWVGSGTGNITAFQLSSSGPSLTVQSNPVSVGAEPYGLVEDSTGSYVLTANYQGPPYFNSYTFDASGDGQLDPLVYSSAVTNPVAIAAVP